MFRNCMRYNFGKHFLQTFMFLCVIFLIFVCVLRLTADNSSYETSYSDESSVSYNLLLTHSFGVEGVHKKGDACSLLQCFNKKMNAFSNCFLTSMAI